MNRAIETGSVSPFPPSTSIGQPAGERILSEQNSGRRPLRLPTTKNSRPQHRQGAAILRTAFR
jgi:hypothetical protein